MFIVNLSSKPRAKRSFAVVLFGSFSASFSIKKKEQNLLAARRLIWYNILTLYEEKDVNVFMNFRSLGLTAPILKALTIEGYTEPTPIQRQAIPPALAGRDVLGCAQTGTGKTCAFAAPILQRLSKAAPKPRVIRALVLTPTRELAIQIQDSFASYGRNLPLRSAVIFGGVGQQPQVDAIQKGLDILVATPGRLLDLHGQGLVDLSHLEIFVLDEADRMLDMGFIHDVKRVL